MQVIGNEVHITGYSYSSNYPVTNGSTYAGGVGNDIVYTKLNATTGAIITSTYLGGTGWDQSKSIQVIGNEVHISGASTSTNYPVTNGSTHGGGDFDMVYTKLNATTGAIITSTYLGGDGVEEPTSMQVIGNEVHIVGYTLSTNYPVTNGSTFGGGDMVYTKLNATTGAIITSAYIGRLEDIPTSMQVIGNEVHILGYTTSTNYPVTNGSTLGGNQDIVYTKLNATTGGIITSTYLGGSSDEVSTSMQVIGNEVHILGYTFSSNYPVTNGSTGGVGGYIDFVYTKLKATTGAIIASTYLGGGDQDENESPYMQVIGNEVHILGFTYSTNYPVTNGSTFGGVQDIAYTKLNLCPTGYAGSPAVSPAVQNVCANGLFSTIAMANDSIPSSAQPLLYRNSTPEQQIALTALYQWQESTAPGGPFTDIPGAIEKNYVPAGSAGSTKYYRRIAYSMCSGVQTILQTGDVAAVIVGANTAPTVNGGSLFITCPGTNITLGGSPTATPAPGASISSYLWTPADTYTPNNTVANPVAAPATSTIYTVLVTDNNGCQQLGQASVAVYPANAGPDATICAGAAVRIGTQQIPVAGATYSWTSVPAGFTSTEAQPLVSPLVPTTYTVTLTLPVTSGGTCTTTDAVLVTPVAAPANNGGLFAGPDVTICFGSTALLGASGADAGYTYTWAPGNYLPDNHIQRPTFTPGAINFPNPNPFMYYCTALKSGCTFVDSVKAYVIRANADGDGCGPRYIGTPDATPGINNETYNWTVVSGTPHFLGATNLPVIPVGASTGTPTTYRLTVTYNGVSCTDEVIVPVCGGVCNALITVSAPQGCPDYSLNGGNVILRTTNNPDYTYTWTTTGGVTLSAYSGATVNLTNDNAGTVTVTATSTIDPFVFCSYTINVGNPAWSLPLFTAQDVTVCPGVPVLIGQPTVAGYNYVWENVPTLSNYTISNPLATVNNDTTNFPVKVTDIGSGCITRDTATVTITGLPNAAAGSDFSFCGSATGVQLGTTPVAGVTYSWTSTPAGAVFTPNANVANPTVDVAITTTFTVTATNTATGCSVTDAAVATGVPSVAPFTFTNSTFCPGAAGAIALPAGPAGMTSYSWSPAAQVVNATANGPTATTLNPRPQVATTYTLTVTNAGGCTASASTTLTPSATLPDAGSNKVICLKSGGVAIGSSSNPTGGGITYSWSPATNLSSSTSPNPIFTPTIVGSFTYTLTKTEGGCSTTDQVTITVNDFTLPAITSPTICQGSSVQIGTSPVYGTTYFWSPVTGLSATNISNPIANPTSTTTYRLTGMGANGCVASAPVTVNVIATPAPSITLSDVTACLGSSPTLNPVISPAGSYSYVWTPNDGTLSNPNIANPSVLLFGVGTQTYNVVVTNTTTGCSNTKAVNVVSNYCVLPIKLLSFTATLRSSHVLLKWEVSEEINVDRYEIEWSASGFNFASIGSKLANHSSSYTMQHLNPGTGRNYYRLKTIDKDGKVSYSSVMMVVVKNNELVSIFPNPASNTVNIKMGQGLIKTNASVNVISMDGKVVRSQVITGNSQVVTVDVSSLPSAQYILLIKTDTEVISRTVIVAK